MRILSYSTLRSYWERKGNEKAELPLRVWHKAVAQASWASPLDVQKDFPSADQLTKGVMIFDIKGNTYRLVAGIDYKRFTVFIDFIGDHKEYDEFNKRAKRS